MAADTLDPQELRALLEWYVENGVDLALDDAPHDRYADSAQTPAPNVLAEEVQHERPAQKKPLPMQSTPAQRRDVAPVAPDEAAQAAQQIAASARTIDELAAQLASFAHAPFRDMAQHFVFAAGAPGARVMAFDVAPGETEEASGEAFSGREARLLDNMLAAIGFDRTRAYLSYFSPWRPPGLATLTPQQIAIFAPFARRHVELARPDILLIFGEAPARALLGSNEPLNKLRGRMHEARCGAHEAGAFVFASLDAMSKGAAFKPRAWRDLRAAKRLLGA